MEKLTRDQHLTQIVSWLFNNDSPERPELKKIPGDPVYFENSEQYLKFKSQADGMKMHNMQLEEKYNEEINSRKKAEALIRKYLPCSNQWIKVKILGNDDFGHVFVAQHSHDWPTGVYDVYI